MFFVLSESYSTLFLFSFTVAVKSTIILYNDLPASRSSISHHADLYAKASPNITTKGDFSSNTQLTLTDNIAKTTTYSCSSPQAYELNCAVAYYLAQDAVQLYAFEKCGFGQMIAKINQMYDLPSRRYFPTHEDSVLYSQSYYQLLHKYNIVVHEIHTLLSQPTSLIITGIFALYTLHRTILARTMLILAIWWQQPQTVDQI